MQPTDVQHDRPTFTTPNGLVIRWLGTAGYELTSPEGHVLLIDPYVTRVGLARYLTRKIAPDLAKIEAAFTRVDGVLVGHSHFDHVMDTPVIAQRTGAHVYGSRSTANLMQGLGLPATQVTAFDKAGTTTVDIGPFKVTAVPSLHSRFAIGNKVPYAGQISEQAIGRGELSDQAPCTCDIQLKGSDYKCGDVFSYLIDYQGFRVYHLGSANLAEDAVPPEAKGVDLLLMCIAARFATERFVPRALAAFAPERVMPMHYDFMWRDADKPMWLLPRTSFGRLVDDIRTFSRDISVLTLPLVARSSASASRLP